MNSGNVVDIKILKKHAIFLVCFSMILITLGISKKNYSTAFSGVSFCFLSFCCYLLAQKEKALLASYLWALLTPILITSSVFLFKTTDSTALFSCGYLYVVAYLFCSFSFIKKQSSAILMLSSLLFLVGYLSYDTILLYKNNYSILETTFYSKHQSYLMLTKALQFGTLCYFVFIVQKHRYELEITYKTRLEKLNRYASNIINTSKNKLIQSNDLTGALEDILKSSSEALDISRIGVWEYNKIRESIVLKVAYDKKTDAFSCSGELLKKDFPIYFSMILKEQTVAAPDATHHESMVEFNTGYFQKNEIKSMLDTPFFINGEFKGILCFEEQRSLRDWDEMDYLYSISISKLVSTSYYWSEKNINQKTLEQTVQILEKTKTELIQANKAKTLFLANMSHEVRTPLNAILGFSELLTTIKDINTEESKDYLQKIHIGATNLTSILNSILDISAIESGKICLNEEEVEIKTLFKNIIEFYTSQLHSNTEIELVFETEIPNFIWIDKTRLSQIITNLITNAGKFGKGNLITVLLAYQNETLLFTVKDRGIGIDEKRQKIIFESFEQAENSIKREFGGTGLGLAIITALLKLMDGTITLESELGKGASFGISIPAKAIENKAIEDLENLDIENNIDKSKFLTLVVEDNEMNQILIQKIFSKLGYNLQVATTGQEAVDFVKNAKPDLILMDLHMPEMDGFEATKIIRDFFSESELPIVALSADAYVEQINQTIKYGFNDYLTKPVQVHQLKSTLYKYLK